LRIKAEMSQVDAQLTKAENDTKTAGSYLNFLVNVPLDTPISIDSALINNLDLFFVTPPDDVAQTREEILQLNNSVNATRQVLNMKQSYWVPSIVNVTDLGYQGYQYKLKWNLFNGFQNQRRISQAHIDLNSIEVKLTETEKQIELQRQLAKNNLQSSVKAEKANQSSLESSKEYYNIVNREYAEGQKSLLDLLDARNQLTNSSISYSVSHFETLIKKVELERALASYNLYQH
jgi:outer membrane protein TolC